MLRFMIMLVVAAILARGSGCAASKSFLGTDLPNALKYASDRIDAPSERGNYESR